MKKRTLTLTAVAVCLMFVAGYAATTASGLVGEWEISTGDLLTAFNTGVPAFLAPEVRVTINDDNTLTALVIPPLVGWIVRGVVDGTYTTDDATSLSKITVNAGMASIRVLFITLPIQNIGQSVTAIYKIEANDTLYALPTSIIPEGTMSSYEAHPETVPWQGIQMENGNTLSLEFERN